MARSTRPIPSSCSSRSWDWRVSPEPDTEEFQKTDVHRNGVIEVGDALFIAQYNVGLRDVWFELPG
jgi:hypothetical protein